MLAIARDVELSGRVFVSVRNYARIFENHVFSHVFIVGPGLRQLDSAWKK